MRHNKYITSQILLACLSKPAPKKDIHMELQLTIAERQRIMQEMKDFSRRAKTIDMYLSNAA